MQRRVLWAAILSAGLLAACGGGGSSSDATPPSTTANVAATGVAAKGLMAGAIVTAHAVNSDGSVGAVLVTTPAVVTTDANGHYALSFSATQNQPYVIQVAAQAGTTHLDEVSGQAQALPVDFKMRSLLVPTTTGNVTASANITPFSEMAVAAAAGAAGGITAGNAAQAVATVGQLLGFNPTTVAAPSLAADASAEQKKLAVLLAAVSQLANSDALGCNTGSPGDKTKCVVEKLADSASATTINLSLTNGATTTDVSAALGAAIDTVLPGLSGSVDPALLAGIRDDLACTGDECLAVPVPGNTSVATAIASAKLLFANLKSDWAVMFSRGGVSSIAGGAANTEAWRFRQAMTGVQAPAEMLMKDAGTLLMGIDLYNDYQAGRVTVPSRGRGEDLTANDGSADFSNFTTVGCSLYQDSATSVLATAPANANFIGCRAAFYVSRAFNASTVTTTEWRHGFTVTPNVDGSFGYGSRARERVTSCTSGVCTTMANTALQTNAYSGTVTPTLTSGRITAFTITGELPGAFTSGTHALANERHTWSLTGTRAIDAQNMSSTSFSGNVAAFNADGSAAGTLTVASGSTTETPVWRDQFDNEVEPGSSGALSPYGGTLSGGSMNLVWTTPGAEFQGSFSATDSQWDATGTNLAPTQVTLSGALRNIVSGQANEFVNGTLNATVTGFETYNAGQPDSTSNFNTVNFTFTGNVTAPSRPALELTLSASLRSYEDEPAAVTLRYRSLQAGTPRTVIDVSGTRGSNGSMTYSLSEAASNLSMTWVDGVTSGDLRFGTTTIGTLDKNTKLLTFTNGDFMSLDIGL